MKTEIVTSTKNKPVKENPSEFKFSIEETKWNLKSGMQTANEMENELVTST